MLLYLLYLFHNGISIFKKYAVLPAFSGDRARDISRTPFTYGFHRKPIIVKHIPKYNKKYLIKFVIVQRTFYHNIIHILMCNHNISG